MIILQGITVDELLRKIETIIETKLEERAQQRKQEENLRTKYLSRLEVSKLLKITLPTLHEWSKDGKLKSYNIGNRVLYKESEIDLSITGRKHKRDF